jgi:hypothetical protein
LQLQNLDGVHPRIEGGHHLQLSVRVDEHGPGRAAVQDAGRVMHEAIEQVDDIEVADQSVG